MVSILIIRRRHRHVTHQNTGIIRINKTFPQRLGRTQQIRHRTVPQRAQDMDSRGTWHHPRLLQMLLPHHLRPFYTQTS